LHALKLVNKTLELATGRRLLCRWDFPEDWDVEERSVPLAFLVPPVGAKDIDGNAPNFRVKNTMREISQALNDIGVATFRFVLEVPSVGLTLAELLEAYEKSVEANHVLHQHTIFVGMREGADLFARHYYDFFRTRSPGAAILLATGAKVIHLNNLTCPYLVVHGVGDPTFLSVPQQRFQDAVHHHQMRYGDRTQAYLIPNTDREMGDLTVSPLLLDEIQDWVRAVLRDGSRRPQERSAA
jgi:hypothetical protein